MDSTIELEKVIINRIKRLPKQQQQEILDFIDFLEFKLEKNTEIQTNKNGREWKEIKGKAPYPLVEQDAQNWVSINRNKEVKQQLLFTELLAELKTASPDEIATFLSERERVESEAELTPELIACFQQIMGNQSL